MNSFRLSARQKGWKENWIDIKNETRYAKGNWLLISTKSTAPSLRSLDLYYGVPSMIKDFDDCFDQFVLQLINDEFEYDDDNYKSCIERYNRKINVDINTEQGFIKFLDKMYDRNYYFSPTGFGKEPNKINSYDVTLGNTTIKVWAYEFTIPKEEAFADLVEESHDFIAFENNKASETMKNLITDTELKFIYEHALLDGANEVQAIATAYGQEISTVPHLNGYFRCKDSYRNIFV